MSEKALIEYAYDVLSASKESMTFKDLFDKAYDASGLKLTQSELKTRMSKLYTQLSLDGRFVILKDNNWDLRDRHTFSEVHIDMEDAYSEDDDDEADEEELELLRQELGEETDDDNEQESDDLDFDKPQVNQEDDDEEL